MHRSLDQLSSNDSLSPWVSESVVELRPTLATYWRTLKHLRLTQLAFLVRRRLLPTNNIPRCDGVEVRVRPLHPPPTFPEWQPTTARQMLASGRIDFSAPAAPIPALSWSERELSRIRHYQLNYCDFLNVDLTAPNEAPLLRSALKIAIAWHRQSATGSELGWQPFPLTLRIVNVAKFVLRNSTAAEALGARSELSAVLSGLRTQVLSLEHRLEMDMLANHLFKNAKALMFAGAILNAPESERWWHKGEAILTREMVEQVLPDGGHIERSPMYHTWILEHLLDLRALVASVGRPSRCAEAIEQRVECMTAFLRAILHPDGEIPLFNDSALGFTTRTTAEVLARHSSTEVPTTSHHPPRVTMLPNTGYAVIREPLSASFMILDCGPLGPDYQPGHSHCDILSYELSLDGHRVVVDTGVSTYEPGRERHYERSTAAHNTVRVDSAEQAEIWAAFRVGRRPRAGPIRHFESAATAYLQGKHLGYERFRVSHSRTVANVATNAWVVVDVLRGRGDHQIESFIHFHPAVELRPMVGNAEPPAGLQATAWTLAFGSSQYTFKALGHGTWRLRSGWYSPNFGVRHEQHVLACEWRGQLPCKMVYWFEPVGSRPLVVQTDCAGDTIRIDNDILPVL